MDRTYNFSAGPGTLPVSALEEARDEMLVYKDAGASVMEISHRSRQYTELAETTRSHVRKLLGIGDDWHILFLQGGASQQFWQVPLNFLPEGGEADYVVTGSWSAKALKEASKIGHARNVASSEEENFNYIPETGTWDLSEDASYVHITSNNTIFGTQFASDPVVDKPLVCDASSDFMSRPIDMSRYGLIYAGAQKNIGPAGVTVVLIHDDFLKKANGGLPTLMDYRTHTAKLFHTPPVFAVYMVEKVLRWLLELGGLEAVEKRNDEKAAVLYDAIDATDFYRGTAHKKSRSRMNVTFRLPSEDLEAKFVSDAAGEGLMALKGHRSVGGIRASIYNACPPEAVDALVQFMQEFERGNG